jgi:branched-chain amino acid transport system permease protein
MSAYLAAAVAGIGAGAVSALLGLGLVLTARGSGVINFGYGALAGWCAYTYYDLRTNARYPLLIPGPWRDISFGEGVQMTVASAMAITLATAALIGLISYLLVFRALRRAPVLAKVVASVGILLVLQGMIGVRFEGASVNLPKVLPSGVIELTDEILLAKDAMWLAVIAVVLAAALWALSRYTRTGLAVRAASESEKGAVLLGFEPDRLGLITWVLSALIAGIVGIIAAPLFELTPLLFTQLLIPALGAALIGRFISFGWTAAAGLGIGMVQAMASPLQQDLDWLPRTGVRDGFVFLAIVIAMVLLGKRLPTRGSIDQGRMPPVGSGAVNPPVAFGGVVLVAAGFLLLPDAWGLALLTSVLFCGLALSLTVLTGYMGQISLAQMAIAGIGGFSLSRLAERFGVPFPLAPLLAATVAAVFGVLVGIPALRVRGVNLAIVTLAGGIAIQEFVFKNPDFVGDVTTGGAKVPAPALFGWNLGLRSATDPYRPVFGVFVTVVVAVLALLVANVRRSTTGRRMLAVRSNERAAAGVAIGTAGTKLLAFGISSFVAGLAGCLIAYRFGSISDTSFGFFASLTLLAFAYLGGISSVSGAVVAGFLAADGIGFKLINTGWDNLGVDFGRWTVLVGAIGLVITAVQNPDGIAGAVRRVRQRRAQRRPVAAAATATA